MKRQTAFERQTRFLAQRIDQGYPVTDDLRTAIIELVCAASRSARRERGPEFWENDRATKEES